MMLSISCASIATARFCHHQTKGFSMSKIRSNLEGQWHEPGVLPLPPLLQQKFHFLGRGLQSFVFSSEDGQYVLKIFNNRYQRKIQLFSLLSHLPGISSWSKERAAYFEKKLHQTFASYQIAFEEMQDQTGLIYIHLSPTSYLPSSLTIVDALNISHVIDPNQTGFLIQKRATLVYPALNGFLERQDIDGAERAISNLIELFFWKWRHGIADNDPLIRTNYGFLGTQVIQIDVGPLSKQAISCEEQKKKITHITASLKFWLNKNAPELIPILDRELQQQLSSQKRQLETAN